jgi:hypothetical protein
LDAVTDLRLIYLYNLDVLRIEMELVLVGKRIEFSPTCAEVTDMIVSVVHEMNKLLREVPTIQSWITGASNQFVQVTLNKENDGKCMQTASCS